MNRTNALERHLLTRCYNSDNQIEELLKTRYSLTGDQKPVIHFTQYKGQAKTKSLLHSEPNTSTGIITRERKVNTRKDLQVYIKQTLDNQKKVIKKIQAHNRKKTSDSNPFPLSKFIKLFSIPQYEEFIGLNNLWQNYMQDLLFVNNNNNANNDKSKPLHIPSMTTLLPKLSTADYNGCLLTVIQSKNSNLVGLRGIVVWDSQHSFIICVPSKEDSKEWNETKDDFSPSEMLGGFRAVPKQKSLFAFDVILPKQSTNSNDDEDEEDECVGFTMIGSRFEFRAVDRSGKKFKSHSVDGIL
ncbi:Rof/RNase P-like protein [Scheffersomyces coipomensis]|uniref:Rof/RNase P-like protein n=1 Tax=Scheffersomyces coipomensis TaxID=1788519 RepID=UPI00315D09D5